MATASSPLTLDEFHARYRVQKPHFEYWFGQAIQKAMPTTLHGLLQGILVALLRKAGYKAGTEIELRVDPQWEPVPDVIAAEHLERPYPTQPVPVVAEVLSPDDAFPHVIRKCRQYARIGIEKVFILDPEGREAWEWNAHAERPETIQRLELPNGATIQLADVWRELEEQL
jgi:Uma2 family endonuclease